MEVLTFDAPIDMEPTFHVPLYLTVEDEAPIQMDLLEQLELTMTVSEDVNMYTMEVI